MIIQPSWNPITGLRRRHRQHRRLELLEALERLVVAVDQVDLLLLQRAESA